ncbi:MAG: protein kinase [Planctomycetes bacterium]|nr:protein kinase [Planctomycetota bacterium]
MSVTNSPGSPPEPDFPFTIPEPLRSVEPMETPAPGELTTPQLPGLETQGPPGRRSRWAAPRIPGFPEIPGFELTEEIARGGMGVVYAAREIALCREVAIKTLLPVLAGDRQMRDQFDREACISAKLQHPGVPPIYRIGTLSDGRPYLVMKLIRGRTLAAILAARAQRATTESISDLDLTTPDAPGLLLVFEQICQAVAFAHSQGIIHRDLKPANIMVGPFGEVQVMDWGLAREMKREKGNRQNEVAGSRSAVHADSATTHNGTAKGTPSYMPPEQARGEWDAVDARADVFALGGILCTLLTGSAPYTGDNIRVVIDRAMEGDLFEAFARLDTCGASVELVRLAKWCLSPDLTERLSDARAVAGLVELYRLGQEEQVRAESTDRDVVVAEVVTRRVPSEAPQPRPSMNQLSLSAVIAGVVIGLCAAYCWLSF